MRARVLIVTLALGCVLLAGCRNRSHRNPPRSCPPGNMTIPPVGIPDGAPPAPIPRGDPGASAAGAELLLPQPPPGKSRSEYPRIVGPDNRGATLGDPDYADPKSIDAEKPPSAAPDANARRSDADHPAGIADFADVKDGVSTGQRPTIDGLDWLKSKRIKTLVYLRLANEDDTTDRRQVELRSMKYASKVVSPQTLTKEWMDEFNRLVSDSPSQPIFVYGDRSLSGAVWYAHLRMVDYLTHDEARVRARRYGRIDEESELFRTAMQLVSAKP